jgi:hypothetical protein
MASVFNSILEELEEDRRRLHLPVGGQFSDHLDQGQRKPEVQLLRGLLLLGHIWVSIPFFTASFRVPIESRLDFGLSTVGTQPHPDASGPTVPTLKNGVSPLAPDVERTFLLDLQAPEVLLWNSG